jgi:hypothetical protein
MKKRFKCKYYYLCDNSISLSNTSKEYKKYNGSYSPQKYICPHCKEKKKNAKLNIFQNKEYFYSSKLKKIKHFYLEQLNLKCYFVKSDFLDFKEDNILFFNIKDNMNYIGLLNNQEELNNLINSILTNKTFLKVFKEIKDLDIDSIDKKISSAEESIIDNYNYLKLKEKEKIELENKIKTIKDSSVFYFFNTDYQNLKNELKEKINYIDIYKEYCIKEEKRISINISMLIKERLSICNSSLFSENNYLENFLNQESVKDYLIKQIYIDLK